MAKVLKLGDSGFPEETTVTVGGGGPEAVATKTDDYTITTDDKNIFCDCSSGDITLTLPVASGNDGTRLYIKKIDDSNNTITIVPNGTEAIDGESSIIIENENTAINMVLNTNWYIQ
jgi:hypothetical protein